MANANGAIKRTAAILVASGIIAIVALAARPHLAAKGKIDEHLLTTEPHPILSMQIKQIAADVEWMRDHMEHEQ